MSRSQTVGGAIFVIAVALTHGCGKGYEPAPEKLTITERGESNDKILLRGQPKIDTIYTVRLVTDQNVDQKVQGRTQRLDQSIGMEMAIDWLKQHDNGDIDASLKYTWMKFKQSGGGMTIDYDSATSRGDPQPLAMGFAALVGTGFEITLAPSGEARSVRGIDRMVKQVVDNLKGPAPMRDAVAAEMRKQMTDEKLMRDVGTLTAMFPDEPVGVGDVWRMRQSGEIMFKVNMHNTWKLIERKDGVATIELTSYIEPLGAGEQKGPDGSTMRFQLEGKQQGTMQVDEATGLTIRSDLTQALEGEMTLTAKNGDSIRVPMSINSVVTITGATADKPAPAETPAESPSPEAPQ